MESSRQAGDVPPVEQHDIKRPEARPSAERRSYIKHPGAEAGAETRRRYYDAETRRRYYHDEDWSDSDIQPPRPYIRPSHVESPRFSIPYRAPPRPLSIPYPAPPRPYSPRPYSPLPPPPPNKITSYNSDSGTINVYNDHVDMESVIETAVKQALQIASIAPPTTQTASKDAKPPLRQPEHTSSKLATQSPPKPIPHELIRYLHRGAGNTWTFLKNDLVPLQTEVPLQFGGMPIVVPLPSIDRHLVFVEEDPYAQYAEVDPTEPVPDHISDLIFDHFPFADGFCVFIDGTLQLIAPNLALEDVSPLPTRFIGMRLSISQCVPVPSSDDSVEDNNDPATSGTTTEETGDPLPHDTMNKQGRVVFHTDERIKPRRSVTSVAGLLIKTPGNDGPVSSLVSSNHAAYQSLGGIIHSLKPLLCFCDSSRKIRIAETVVRDGRNNSEIGQVSATYDDDPLPGHAIFPDYFSHDVCLISTQSQSPEYFSQFTKDVKWNKKYETLGNILNRSVRVFGDIRDGMTVGQYVQPSNCSRGRRLLHATGIARPQEQPSKALWDNSILYRRLGPQSSLKRLSGAPVVVIDKTDPNDWTLLGFQSLAFVSNSEAQYMEHELSEAETKTRLRKRTLNLWGTRVLPEALTQILKTSTLLTTPDFGRRDDEEP